VESAPLVVTLPVAETPAVAAPKSQLADTKLMP